jgi:hypothetical protein
MGVLARCSLSVLVAQSVAKEFIPRRPVTRQYSTKVDGLPCRNRPFSGLTGGGKVDETDVERASLQEMQRSFARRWGRRLVQIRERLIDFFKKERNHFRKVVVANLHSQAVHALPIDHFKPRSHFSQG